jgi:hypothetical protein
LKNPSELIFTSTSAPAGNASTVDCETGVCGDMEAGPSNVHVDEAFVTESSFLMVPIGDQGAEGTRILVGFNGLNYKTHEIG